MENASPPFNIFRKHPLTEEQELLGSTFTVEQEMWLENVLAKTGEEIVRLTVLESDPNRFLRVANAQGQVTILQYLLECSRSNKSLSQEN